MGLTKEFGKQYRKPNGFFGKLIGRQMNNRHVPLTEWALEFMEIQPSDSVLDIGCGGGMGIRKLAAMVTSGFVAGIDHSETMLEMAIEYNAKAIHTDRVEIRHGTVAHLSYENEFFHKVWSLESFYYWPDPVENLAEVCRVLKPGGRIVVVLEWCKEMPNIRRIEPIAAKMNCPLYSGIEIEELLSLAGFTSTHSEFKDGPSWLLVIGYRSEE